MFAVSSCDGVVSPDVQCVRGDCAKGRGRSYFEYLLQDATAWSSQFALAVVQKDRTSDMWNRLYEDDFKVIVPVPVPPLPRTSRHRPLPRPRRPAHPALHPRQAEAHHAAGGAEAGHYQPRRHRPDRSAHRPALPSLQGLRRGVAGGGAGALGGTSSGRLVTLTVGFPFKSEGFTQSDNDIRLCAVSTLHLDEYGGRTWCVGKRLTWIRSPNIVFK